MSDVNVQLVREFFELNGFRTMTYWQHDRTRAADHGLQLFVENGAAPASRELEFNLRPGDAPSLQRALVEVRPWHGERVYSSHIENNPVLFDVACDESAARARQVFGEVVFKTILVISELPTSPESRQRSLALLQAGRIDHIIEFSTILHDILDKLNPQISYSPSHTLQTLRLMKRYGFIRRHQLEFPFHNEPLITGASSARAAGISGDELPGLFDMDTPEEPFEE